MPSMHARFHMYFRKVRSTSQKYDFAHIVLSKSTIHAKRSIRIDKYYYFRPVDIAKFASSSHVRPYDTFRKYECAYRTLRKYDAPPTVLLESTTQYQNRTFGKYEFVLSRSTIWAEIVLLKSTIWSKIVLSKSTILA